MEELITFMSENGFTYGNFPLDERFHRFKRNNRGKNGWFIGKEFTTKKGNRAMIASFGDWSTGETHHFKPAKNLSSREARQINTEITTLKKKTTQERKSIQVIVACDSAELWKNGSSNKSSKYLETKQISDLFGAKTNLPINGGRELWVPCRDINGKLWGIQKISEFGEKFFTTGQRISGCFHAIGESLEIAQKAFVCEGFSTGASIYQAIGGTIICGFNAGNLKSVCKALRGKYSHLEIVICADNDQFTESGNVGVSKAEEAAKICGASVIYPNFKDLSEQPTDFNDLYILEGSGEVSRQILNVKPKLIAREYQNQSTGFYSEEGDKDIPDYYGLAEYAIHEKSFISNGKYCSVFKKTHFFSLNEQEEDEFITDCTKDKVTPDHINKFKKILLAKSQIKNGKQFKDSTGLINVANGILNTKSHQLTSHSPKYHFTYVLNHKYDPKQKCPEFIEFLNYVFEGDQELVQLTFQIFGYTIYGGHPFLHKAFDLFGTGRNGKSTWLEVLKLLIGAQNYSTVSMSNLNKPFSVVSMDGKIANIVEESPNSVLDSEAFKAIVGGGEITAAQKHKPEYPMKSNCRLFFANNSLPKFGDPTAGTYERLVFLPFKRYIPKANRKHGLIEKFKQEMSGILNQSLEGLATVLQQGCLIEPKASMALLNEYRKDSDNVYLWANNKIAMADQFQSRYTGQCLYDYYKSDCEKDGLTPCKKTNFEKRFAAVINEMSDTNKIPIDQIRRKSGDTRYYHKIEYKSPFCFDGTA